MKLGYVILYVANVNKTVSFYEKAFHLQVKFMHESQCYAEMETGQTTLAFVSEDFVDDSIAFKKNSLKEFSAGAEIAFVTEEVKKQFDHALSAGAISIVSPTEKPWGQTVSYVRDNNGFLVEICSPLSVK